MPGHTAGSRERGIAAGSSVFARLVVLSSRLVQQVCNGWEALYRALYPGS
jgi:hypothetical protein